MDQAVAYPAVHLSPLAIDWARMACPQPDQYDSHMVLKLAGSCASLGRPTPYRQRPTGQHPTIFDGCVAVRALPRSTLREPDFVLAPADHPNLAAAARYVACWPEACEQFKLLIDTVIPLYDATIVPAERCEVLGSCSHSDEDQFGSLMATVEDPLGLAQAMLHEMAHQKLRALGISVEGAQHLIVNEPDETYRSPVRHDAMRPMTAIFHAVYSFIHVVALDVRMIAAEEDPAVRERMVLLLARNVPRMQMGFATLRESLRTDPAGAVFCGAFMRWAEAILATGEEVLAEHGFGYPDLG
jgi:hypothetical protein